MDRLAGEYSESTVTDVKGLQLTGGDGNDDQDGDEDEDEDEDEGAEFGEQDEVITKGIDNVIDERRVIASHESSTGLKEFGNLNERLVGWDNGCFCGEVGYRKDSGIETPMVSVGEMRSGRSGTCRAEEDKAEFHGIRTFIKEQDRPSVPREYDRTHKGELLRPTTVEEVKNMGDRQGDEGRTISDALKQDLDGPDMARTGVG